MPTDDETFALLFSEVARGWRNELDRRLKPLKLSQSRWLALLHLSRAGGELTQRDLALNMAIERATLVGVLDGLEAEGLIERREHDTDRRLKYVRLTPASKSLQSDINGIASGLRKELLGRVPREDLRTALTVLGTIKDALE